MKKLSNLFLLIFLCTSFTFATNPEISKNLVNLSANIAQTVNEDNLPEMIIEGNTIHALWTTYVSGDEAYLFYCRSTDLGETWETPQQLWQYKNSDMSRAATMQRLAVSGENVYIGICDYDYNNNGTGYIYLVKSANGGESFGEAEQLTDSGGGYSRLSNCFIRSSGNKVAIVYRDANYNNAFEGLNCLYSDNNGNTFNKTTVSEEYINNVSDFLFDGTQLIVVHEYTYYSYGLAKGQVYVSVSNDGGASFTTNKVSLTHGESEKNRSTQDQHYVPKVVKDGNNIHLIFTGNNAEAVWSVLYTRSTNGGNTFEEARDFGSEILAAGGKGSWFQTGFETITSKGGYVYLTYLRGDGKCYYQYSSDNGAVFSDPENILTEDTKFIQYTWWPQLVIDPSDETGKTVYFGSGEMMTRKSIDGGKSFHNTTYLFPIFDAPDVGESVLKIDNQGNIHWLTQGRFHRNYDFDIFYAHKMPEPEPGSTNKSYSLKTTYSDIQETTIVPSSASIEFDSAMTAEAWIRVKYDESGKISFFTKVNGNDSYITAPSAYNIGLNQYYGRETLHLCAGIETDRGDFVIEPDNNIHPILDSLWHHIAFTYDANAGLNNFKAYMDGLLVGEQTALGEILQGDGLLIIGSSAVISNSKYEMDDIRLWNRALTQKELIENQTKKLTGKETGLKLFLNFDDTFKDISGNGNDAIPLYLGDLKVSDFDPPLTNFDIYQVDNEVSLNNKTKNGTAYNWNLGNEDVSVLGNPKYAYLTPGEYVISLLASNANSVTANIDNVSIKGLDRIEPTEAGNIGESLLAIYGGGLNATMKVLLRFEDNTEIVADTVVDKGEDGFLQALFTLTGAKTGIWDVVIIDNNEENILPKAFTINEAEGEAQPWINVSGRATVLLNRWNKFTITYGNKGEVDALMVPVSFAVPDIEGLEVDYMDFQFVFPDEIIEHNLVDELMPYKDFFITDMLFGKPQKSKVYSVMIPRIKANSSESLHIIIKSPVNYKITSWTGDGWLKYANENENSTKSGAFGNQFASTAAMGGDEPLTGAQKKVVGSCLMDALGTVVVETSISIIPYVGATYNTLKHAHTAYQFDTKDVKKSLRNTSIQGATTFFAVAGTVPVIGWAASTIGGLICGGISAYFAVSDCLSLANKVKNVSTVASFDPNEIIGPDGFGTNGWITKLNEMPYTILFENKAVATAPAHDVFIADTLDLAVFDITNFGFGSFGWGDTILSPPGKQLKEFSMDIDLRPRMDLLTRVSGKLDTITGIINWEFLSLNPETMNLEEDPFVGFLPPNNSSPEGEGFVSYSVGAKEELKTGSEIRNQASIVFDANKAIITNNYLNTFDEDAPESQIYPLDATIGSHFTVGWSGSDKGSGVGSYSIYVLENDTLLYQWIVNTTESSAEFEGKVGSTYKFYSLATDNVGHVELEPDEYDASTMVTVGIEALKLINEDLKVYPNPAAEKINVLLNNAPCGDYAIELIGMNGTINHSRIYSDFDLNSGVEINLDNCVSGQYVLKIIYENTPLSRKIIVK